MWSFRKKRKRPRDREKAVTDTSSLGNMLLKARLITVEQLRQALEYQDTNPDHMLGEALVRTKGGNPEDVKAFEEIVRAFLAMQEIEDGRASRKSLAQVVELAKNRKKPLHDAHDRAVAAAMLLSSK